MFSILARFEKIYKEKDELTKLLNHYKVQIQNAQNDILKKDNFLTS